MSRTLRIDPMFRSFVGQTSFPPFLVRLICANIVSERDKNLKYWLKRDRVKDKNWLVHWLDSNNLCVGQTAQKNRKHSAHSTKGLLLETVIFYVFYVVGTASTCSGSLFDNLTTYYSISLSFRDCKLTYEDLCISYRTQSLYNALYGFCMEVDRFNYTLPKLR